MVFFLSILGWSFLEPLDQSNGSDRWKTCNLQENDDPTGCVGRHSDG